MIQEATDMKIANPNVGWELLEDVLKDLKNGNNTTVNKKNSNNDMTALHYAAWLGAPDIVQALLDGNADPNPIDSDSYTPFHITLTKSSFDNALLLLNSNKMSQANLEAAVIVIRKGTVTALAYAQEEEAIGDADQANWQAVINALKVAGAKK
jgi:ankyrin repeat protein